MSRRTVKGVAAVLLACGVCGLLAAEGLAERFEGEAGSPREITVSM